MMLALAQLPGVPANIHWNYPWALALLIVPLLLAFLRFRRPAAVVLPSQAVAARLPRSLRQRLLWLPRALLLLAMGAGIIALARPQRGEGKLLTSTDAVAIQLVVDRSGSMALPMTMDGQELSRLDVVKNVVRDFLLGDGKSLAGRAADLIGLVQFARYADTACPLVRDHKAVVSLVEAIHTASQRYEDGTSIGDGLALAAARLRTAEQDLAARHTELKSPAADDFRIKSKVIVLLTDGDNNAGVHDPLESAKLAAQWGIKVYTIGLGGDTYMIQHTFGGDMKIPVRGDVDAKTLKAIAEATGGKFFAAQDGATLRNIYAEIDRLEKSTVKTVDYTDYTELFTPIAFVALALLALHTLVGSTWLRRTP